ncbi:MAG TPA: trypsin-like peptidase domain-containing protein [Gammaproteobacteria bacterium]|nr:trypsin-like peptidase domain-containing protein [Gammaproteobacteria bacterium]
MKILTVYAAWVAALLVASPVLAEQATWNRTLEQIASGVVSIEVDSTRSFDTERNETAQATGFVVDAKRGLILTNRHVVTPGPVRARAIFMNQEEVELQPVYRDPVHDFGFFHYDPKQLHFIHPAELPLAPDAAKIGMDIRVVGNDAGERLSILAGTIARLDRQAPNYGRGNYNDFNTFYLQAASGTSGGSSGSPVIDIQGQVVALNAGANTQAATSFFLPLDRVRVALQLIQQGLPVPRGTLQTEFVHQPYAELHRLGLTREAEAKVREADPNSTGMLVVKQVIPESPAADQLQPGDILLSVDGKPIYEFVPLEAALDDNVGDTVPVVIERGGQDLTQNIRIDNLYSITPDEYVEYGDGVLHELSYEQARHYYRPAKGIYVADPGYVFGSASIPRASIVTEIEGQQVETLDDLQKVLESLPEGAQISVRFIEFDDPRIVHQSIFTNNRSWFTAARCKRDDTSGLWPCKAFPPAPPAQPLVPQTTTFPPESSPALQHIAPSLVFVNFSMPYTISGVSDRYYYGSGIVVDAKRGWVVVDRNTVPVAMGDVRLTFAGSIEIPGHVEYVNPLHNLAVVSYDPKLLGNTPVQSAEFSEHKLAAGNAVDVVGFSPDDDLRSQATEVASVSEADFPVSRTLRFRDSNLETAALVNGPADFNGAILDPEGRVEGLWASFAVQSGREVQQINMGIPSYMITDMLAHLRKDEPVYSLDVEWRLTPLATARKLSLPASWGERYEAHNPERREVLAVASTVAGSPAAKFFRSGDILLSVDGELANTFEEVERLSQAADVNVTIERDGREIEKQIPTVALSGRGVERIVLWAGALVQSPHRALAAQRGVKPTGVYVSYFNFGSPASRAGLYAGRRIVAIDGKPTPDLDSFIAVVKGLGRPEAVRLKTVDWNDVPEVITLEPDPLYWPSYELERAGYDWRRIALGAAPANGAIQSGTELPGPVPAEGRNPTLKQKSPAPSAQGAEG